MSFEKASSASEHWCCIYSNQNSSDCWGDKKVRMKLLRSGKISWKWQGQKTDEDKIRWKMRVRERKKEKTTGPYNCLWGEAGLLDQTRADTRMWFLRQLPNTSKNETSWDGEDVPLSYCMHIIQHSLWLVETRSSALKPAFKDQKTCKDHMQPWKQSVCSE